jgi:DNA integrity scanning protein DisA with diadenylate cyclase activity
MAESVEIVHALFSDLFERGVRYFFPDAALVEEGPAEFQPSLAIHTRTDGSLDLEWIATRYRFERSGRPFTENQVRLLAAIGAVLTTRYRGIFYAASTATSRQLFEGLAEDRYVSAFLNHAPYLCEDAPPEGRDTIADALEVLRESSLITYENRRISTGVVLMGAAQEHATVQAAPPAGALSYGNALVAIKSFHRLCDGLHTVFLVDRNGMLVDLVDVRQFAGDRNGVPLPAPSAARWHAHSLATLHGGNICLVLTPNGEMKAFAGGVQVFNFLEGRWRLTDLTEKYHQFRIAVGDARLAERLFTAALNLAEHRRGGLFVVLDQPEGGRELLAPQDLLDYDAPDGTNKGQIHYLLRGKRVLEIELSVLQSIARMDGGIVLDRAGRLLAFGAILRNSSEHVAAQEGGRTTAAVHASRVGLALKISEDGLVSFYRGGSRVWEI